MIVLNKEKIKVTSEDVKKAIEPNNKLEEVTAKVKGVENISEGDVNNIVPEPIKPLQEGDIEVSEEEYNSLTSKLAEGLEGAEPNKIYEITLDEHGKVINRVESKTVTVSKEKETVFIYCGPTTQHVSRYTSYKKGYPAHLKDHMDKCKVLKSLFVTPEDFSSFENNVNQTGTVENIWFEEAKKYFSKAVKA